MDEVARKMAERTWSYADKDPAALTILEERIAAAGRELRLITYSDLVNGVTFHLPSVRNGEAYQISIYEWSALDRAIIGDFLGYISMRSWEKAGFMASSLVVDLAELKPSAHFFNWVQELDFLPDTHEETVLEFWADQVNKAHNWFSADR